MTKCARHLARMRLRKQPWVVGVMPHRFRGQYHYVFIDEAAYISKADLDAAMKMPLSTKAQESIGRCSDRLTSVYRAELERSFDAMDSGARDFTP